MKLSEFKEHLNQTPSLQFIQTDGHPVPAHFHITEAGLTEKHFVDCGGTLRTEKVIHIQMWSSTDTDHRLAPSKVLSILSIYEKHFGTEDLEIEVEYQTETIGRYGLSFHNNQFQLTPKYTDCLASDHCGITPAKKKIAMADLNHGESSCCTPGSGCC